MDGAGAMHRANGHGWSMIERSRIGSLTGSSQPKSRDPYAVPYRWNTAYGSLLSQGRLREGIDDRERSRILQSCFRRAHARPYPAVRPSHRGGPNSRGVLQTTMIYSRPGSSCARSPGIRRRLRKQQWESTKEATAVRRGGPRGRPTAAPRMRRAGAHEGRPYDRPPPNTK